MFVAAVLNPQVYGTLNPRITQISQIHARDFVDDPFGRELVYPGWIFEFLRVTRGAQGKQHGDRTDGFNREPPDKPEMHDDACFRGILAPNKNRPQLLLWAN